MHLCAVFKPYLRSDGSYTPLSPATDSSDTAEVTPTFFVPAPLNWGAESEDDRKKSVKDEGIHFFKISRAIF